MQRYLTFSYSDNLSKQVYLQLPDSLKLTGDSDSELLLILRLLSGNVELTHNYSNIAIKSRVNYFSGDLVRLRNWKKDFPVLFSEDTTAEDLSIFVQNTKYINRSFYSVILAEISHFILHTKKGAHTSAFIYIYRILEKISYAFPLIYTSKTQDFLKSFDKLKELMVGDKEKKELGFFKKFIDILYKNDSLSDTSIDINLNPNDSSVREQMFKSLKEVIDSSIIHEDSTEYYMLAIKYTDMGSFIITLRNRFFHNLNGGAKNIESNKIVDSDELFSFINPMAMHWIAMVFLQVTSYSLSEFQKHRQHAVI
ncbi:hypothetical protein [Psychrobacter maritimus]|uniref:hypothetical protein n=1 Tax=Psychrobacter maritimus TaxID=256325 RepID=UPI00191A8B0B|nr:hypothetical protein [Psychrobacter maritimus]